MNRLTVVDLVYHECDADPGLKATEHRYARLLNSNDTWYQRPPFVVTEEPKPIDLGWITKPGMLVIENREKPDSGKVVEVLLGANAEFSWIIMPGETMRGVPSQLGSVYLRCLQGPSIVACTIIPA